jgi:hypothetical protein
LAQAHASLFRAADAVDVLEHAIAELDEATARWLRVWRPNSSRPVSRTRVRHRAPCRL